MKHKDINECLQAGVPRDVVARCVAEAEFLRPDKLKNIYDFEDEIWQKFHPIGREQLGLVLPWGNFHGSSLQFRFRYGEVTVWTGFNKHGKSEVLNHVIVDLCWQGEKALICSLEVQAPETYRKLIRMVQARRDVIAVEERAVFKKRCLEVLSDKVWVYDHVGNAPVEDVLNVMLYAYQRFGCRQFVLDSLMRFEGLDGDGQEIWINQRNFMNAILNFAALYNVHVHLVAHSKKPDKKGEAAIPRRYDVMGSSYITNLAFNCIVIWRNRAKQDALEEIFQDCAAIWIRKQAGKEVKAPLPQWKRLLGGPPGKRAPDQLKAYWNAMLDVIESLPEAQKDEFEKRVMEHDAYLIVDAQRGGDGDCPTRHLWFHYDSLQFLEASPWEHNDARGQPRPYATQTPGGEPVDPVMEPEPREAITAKDLPSNAELGIATTTPEGGPDV